MPQTQKTQTKAPRVIGKRTQATERKPRRVKREATPIAQAAPVVQEAAQHTDVRSRALLVELVVHQWLASSTDVKITDDVAQQHGIAHDMGRYEKRLMSKAALARLRSAGSKLRSVHNSFTLPWADWGCRILHAVKYPDYSARMRAAMQEFDQIFREELEAIDPATGLTKYEAAKSEAKRLLNGAFREEDYPTIEVLRQKFGAEINVMPIPAGTDFRIDMSADVMGALAAQVEADTNKRITVAMQGVYEQFKSKVEKLVNALKAEKTDAIRKTLFTSLETFLEALPGFNITADPALEAFGAEIQALVKGLDASSLRDSETLRAETLVKADAILAKMNDFLG